MVRELQKNLYKGNYSGVDLDGSPDFVKLAEAYGIASKRISRAQEEPDAIQELLACEGPFLLECVVSPEETTL